MLGPAGAALASKCGGCPFVLLLNMASEASPSSAPPGDVLAALDSLVVNFSEGRAGQQASWKLSVAANSECADAHWTHSRDAALLVALRSLQSMGGLPSGLAARNAACWQAALFALHEVKAALMAGGDAPYRADGHSCSPGYDNSCRQVRVVPAAAVSCRAWVRCGLRQWIKRKVVSSSCGTTRPKLSCARALSSLGRARVRARHPCSVPPLHYCAPARGCENCQRGTA